MRASALDGAQWSLRRAIEGNWRRWTASDGGEASSCASQKTGRALTQPMASPAPSRIPEQVT